MWLTISLDVQRASAKNAYCIYGHPAPFAFIGFAHALCQRAELTQQSGVLAIFHHIDPHVTALKFDEYSFDMGRSAQRDTKEFASSKGKTQLDMPTTDLSVSLCFQCTAENYDNLSLRLAHTLDEMRFAGGVIAHSSFKAAETSDEAFRFRAGYAMVSASILPGEENVFARLINTVSIKKGKAGWYSPSLVGFRLMEAPQLAREGAREGHPHAYADPLIGVVQFKSARKVTVADLWVLERTAHLLHFKTGADSSVGTDPATCSADNLSELCHA